jgi:hypothetical protein
MKKRTPRRYAGKRVFEGREYDVWRYEPDDISRAVGQRTHPRQNSFDQSYIVGRLPEWIRSTGQNPNALDDAREWMNPAWQPSGGQGYRYPEPRPLGYNRPRVEEPYLEALTEFFDTRIALMPPKPRQDIEAVRGWVRSVMNDRRTLEDRAGALGITRQAVQQAQKRAVEQLVESCGGKAAVAEKLREYLHAKEGQDGRERLKFLPRWIHG